MNEWKDLTGTAPIEIFIDKKYQIGLRNGKYGKKHDILDECNVSEILKDIDGSSWYYSYRLKPLESIRITAEALRDLYYMIDSDFKQRRLPDMADIENKYGRKVEIID